MGRPTAIRSVDSWVVGAAGRLDGAARAAPGRRGRPAQRARRRPALRLLRRARRARRRRGRARRPARGRPRGLRRRPRAPTGGRCALTATCAAHALGLVADDDARAPGRRGAAALRRLRRRSARALRRSGERGGARRCSTARCDKIADAVAEAARAHGFGPDVPVVALGGAGPALAPARSPARLGRPLLRPEHPEVLSSIGAALSLVRAEVVRHASGPGDGAGARARGRARVRRRRRRAADRRASRRRFEARDGLLRAVATGAVALESGAAVARAARRGRPARRRRRGARAPSRRRCGSSRATGFYRVFADDGAVAGRGRRRPRHRARVPSARGASSPATTRRRCSAAARARRSTRARRTSASPRCCRASASSPARTSSTSATAAARRTSSRAPPPPSTRPRGRPSPWSCADGAHRGPSSPRRAAGLMSLYRQAGARRRRRRARAVALAAGGDARRARRRPGRRRRRRAHARRPGAGRAGRGPRALDGLELLGTEYRQAVRDGRVVAPTEYAAAQADVARARAAVAGLSGDGAVQAARRALAARGRRGGPARGA